MSAGLGDWRPNTARRIRRWLFAAAVTFAATFLIVLGVTAFLVVVMLGPR